MELGFTSDAEEFAERVGPFLAASLECNVLATVLDSARRSGRPGVFAYGRRAGEVVLAALRVPPRGMLASAVPAEAVDTLIERWLELDPGAPWVGAPPASARALAAAWARRSGGRTELRMAQALHVLEEVRDPARPAPGRLRPATRADRELLGAWWRAFATDARVDAHAVEATVDARLAERPPLIWEDSRPVSFVQTHPPVARVVRLGPVYTPPELRRRG